MMWRYAEAVWGNGLFERQRWQSFRKFWPVVANSFTRCPVADTFADSGRPSFQETLFYAGFDWKMFNRRWTRMDADLKAS